MVGECYASTDPRCALLLSGYKDCCLAPNGTVNFNDISAVVDKFKNKEGAPAKARADIAPQTPQKIVDFDDISAVVEAFRGLSYPYGGLDDCPLP